MSLSTLKALLCKGRMVCAVCYRGVHLGAEGRGEHRAVRRPCSHQDAAFRRSQAAAQTHTSAWM